ncbi:MAG TPA: hypothetical protein PLY97_08275 [Acidocella sp.]|nr:hypothetical protein [Acidocella sp.]
MVLDFAPAGDFSCYDQVLDMSVTLGNLSPPACGFHGDALDKYSRLALCPAVRTNFVHLHHSRLA